MDWPYKDETLFQADKDWHNNACLPPYWTSLARYGENYKDAADTLIDAAMAGQPSSTSPFILSFSCTASPSNSR
jgi:hypothetical protein